MFTNWLLIFITLALTSSKGFCTFENKTYQDVLKNNFKKCKLVKENVFITIEQQKKIKAKLDFRISKLLLRYKNPCANSNIYIDSHIVRTQNETVVLEIKNKKVSFLKIASFMEPKEYLPPKRWLDLFLRPTKNIDALTGATLSQNAIKKLVEKYIVIDNILNDKI